MRWHYVNAHLSPLGRVASAQLGGGCLSSRGPAVNVRKTVVISQQHTLVDVCSFGIWLSRDKSASVKIPHFLFIRQTQRNWWSHWMTCQESDCNNLEIAVFCLLEICTVIYVHVQSDAPVKWHSGKSLSVNLVCLKVCSYYQSMLQPNWWYFPSYSRYSFSRHNF